MDKQYSFVFLLIAVVIVSGCVGTTTTTTNTESAISPITAKTNYVDSAEFLLELKELPADQNWTLVERGERNVNDVFEVALANNWSGGYYAKFKSIRGDDFVYVDQTISVYPLETILAVLAETHPDSEPLTNPGIGEHSKAVKYRDDLLGYEVIYYRITFVKNNILVNVGSIGTVNDYLELKKIAQKAYDNIDGYGQPLEIDRSAIKKTTITSTEEDVSVTETNPTETTTPEIEEEIDTATMGEKNALKKALSYLDVLAFSREGLIEQLEYDRFTHQEAVYGVDNSGADWNKQAALKAQSYLDVLAFSREGLIEQLEYDGFTRAQAEYGVEAVGY